MHHCTGKKFVPIPLTQAINQKMADVPGGRDSFEEEDFFYSDRPRYMWDT